MKYLLDTSVMVDMMRHGNKAVIRKIHSVGIDNCCITDITAYELYDGAYRKNVGGRKRTKEEIDIAVKRVDDILCSIAVMSTTDAMKTAGKQKAYLMDNGETISDTDIIIGAAAIWNDLILVTSNEKHHGRLFGIQLENWRNA